jgi:hypothetical protein
MSTHPCPPVEAPCLFFHLSTLHKLKFMSYSNSKHFFILFQTTKRSYKELSTSNPTTKPTKEIMVWIRIRNNTNDEPCRRLTAEDTARLRARHHVSLENNIHVPKEPTSRDVQRRAAAEQEKLVRHYNSTLCHYFATGNCRFGARCNRLHQLPLCVYWARCRKGNCRRSHQPPADLDQQLQRASDNVLRELQRQRAEALERYDARVDEVAGAKLSDAKAALERYNAPADEAPRRQPQPMNERAEAANGSGYQFFIRSCDGCGGYATKSHNGRPWCGIC